MRHKILLYVLCCFSLVLVAQEKNMNYSEETIGNTYFDLQTQRTMQNRIYYFDDGTIGAVWNMGMDFPNFPDLGVGYNYFDGDSWGPDPWQSITSGWAINPSYTAFGENGEMVVSQGENGLILSIRETKGTGAWQQNNFTGSGLKHPVVVTSGPNHDIIHLLYLKTDESFTPTPAQPYRGFFWYARSSDGSQSWDISQQVSELGPDNYLGFTIGSYCWAEPKGDVISFVAGDYLTDLVLMKSVDGGDTWQKTVIWENPYPMFEIFSFESDSFYCNNGGISIALNNENEANVAFTLNRVHSPINMDSLWYDPAVGGVVYWNENRPAFSNNLNALNPYGHPDSELIDDYSLIGWAQDINGNDTLEIEGIETYPTPGLCVMPQIAIDDWSDNIIVTFCSITEGYYNDSSNYRHNWFRASPNGDWWGGFTDLNDGLIFIFSECVYPSIAPSCDSEGFHFTFQVDDKPGLNIPFSSLPTLNEIWFMTYNFGTWPSYWVIADFESSDTSIFIGDSIQFTNYSDGYPFNQLTYQWWFEGGDPESSNEVNPIVVYNESGVFDVKLVASIPQIQPDELVKEDFITVIQSNNVNEITKFEKIDIFPNPGNGIFTINLDFEKTDGLRVEVYNILGENIFDIPIGKVDGQFKLDLTNQQNGIYFIQIKNGSTVVTKKVAVQH